VLRFLFKLSFFLPIAGGMAWVNWHVDPARVFGRHASDPAWYEYERFLGNSLIEGRPQPLVATHNELILDELMFRSFDRLDVLVLGSSSAKPIQKELYGGERFFNAAVFGARLEEMMALDELAREMGLHPRRIVLAIEPVKLQSRTAPLMPGFVPLVRNARARLHLGDDSETQDRWAPLLGLLAHVIGEDESSDVRSLFSQYDTLFSPSYCQYCLRLVIQSFGQRGTATQFVEQFPPPNQHLLHPDGSLQWCEVFLGQTPDDIRRSTGKLPTEQIVADSVRPAAERKHLFEAFVGDLLHSGAVVEFFLPPPNPWLFDEAQRELQQAGKSSPTAETEQYLRSFAGQHGIRVRGSYDPRQAGVSEEDFVDLVHLRREAIERIWDREQK
jgi:hypothetical protein